MNYLLFLVYSSAIFLQIYLGEFLEDVLEFGVWVVIIIVALIIFLAVWLYRKFKGRSRRTTDRPHDFR